MTDAVCPPGTAFARAVESARAQGVVAAAAELVDQLTDDELLGLLDGDTPLWTGMAQMARRYNEHPIVAGQVERLGIPGIRFTDGPRGVVMGASTCFPVAIARAASWDLELERRIGRAIGMEARAQGANLFAGICVNLAPAPGWGRSQESYGEEPVLIGAMGSALAEGARPWVLTCVKHYALNSMENARFTVDVQVDEQTLHGVYLPHFRQVVEGGVDAVMSAYNSVNGEWAGQNLHLLTEILREQWGFQGFVMTDFVWGLRDPVASVAAGQDLEMPFRQQRARVLPAALRDGRLRREDARRAAVRLVGAQIQLALRAEPTPGVDVVASSEHRALAREAAVLGSVLLRNDGVLPIGPQTTVALLGPLADVPALGDLGSSRVHPPDAVTIRQGLQERLGSRLVTDPAHADVAVVVVGMREGDEGESFIGTDPEVVQLVGGPVRSRVGARIGSWWLRILARFAKVGGDRPDLHLRPEDVALISETVAVNPHTVVVVCGGGTVMCDPWDEGVAALLLAWYPGMEGGRAVADILTGDAEPGGRLPIAVPCRREDLPVVDWKARQVCYPRLWGQRKLDHDGVAAAYPFGFGLGYTTFELRSAVREREGVRVEVTNTGARPGRHVVQLYNGSALVGFAPMTADAGETVSVAIAGQGTHVASHAGDPRALPV